MILSDVIFLASASSPGAEASGARSGKRWSRLETRDAAHGSYAWALGRQARCTTVDVPRASEPDFWRGTPGWLAGEVRTAEARTGEVGHGIWGGSWRDKERQKRGRWVAAVRIDHRRILNSNVPSRPPPANALFPHRFLPPDEVSMFESSDDPPSRRQRWRSVPVLGVAPCPCCDGRLLCCPLTIYTNFFPGGDVFCLNGGTRWPALCLSC